MPSIFLVRHAETTFNAVRRVQFPDTPLSERGRWQAARLGARLAEAGLTRIVSSDYARAHATATAVSEASGGQLTLDARLRERHLGDLRGRDYTEVGHLVFAEDADPPGGETWAAFTARVDAAWAWATALADDAGGPLAIITHGLVCRAVAQRHLTLPAARADIRFPNASVTVTTATAPWTVTTVGCTTHLDDDQTAPGAVGTDPDLTTV